MQRAPKGDLTLAQIRLAIAAAGTPLPRKAFPLEDLREAVSEALVAKRRCLASGEEGPTKNGLPATDA